MTCVILLHNESIAITFVDLRAYIAIAGQLPIVTANSGGFHREICGPGILTGLQNGTLVWDPQIFKSIADLLNIVLTLPGCQKLCGSGTGWYPDIGPRLVDWFLPVFLLVSNIYFAPIGWERFLAIILILGDPVDSNWSLLDKVDSWSGCSDEAQTLLRNTNASYEKIDIKSIAVILATMEEVLQSSDQARLSINLDDMFLIREIARALMENRRNDTLRTIFAVAMYMFQVLAAFVPAIGSASTPSGGKVGLAILLSWLVSIVLLSNTVGDFGSHRSNYALILGFIARGGVQGSFRPSRRKTTAWSGAIYCYRPDKCLDKPKWKLVVISVLPVAIAFGTAFAVLETGPTFFSCRNLFVIFASASWIVSAILTYFLSRALLLTERSENRLWNIVLFKDFCIGGTIVGLIIASSCGLWNTCYCWGGAFVHGEKI